MKEKKMTIQTTKRKTELYDSMNQPVSYAIVYGLVPEVRGLIIPILSRDRRYELNYNPYLPGDEIILRRLRRNSETQRSI